jgi:hypothetical protein
MKLFREMLAVAALAVPVSSFAVTFDFAGGTDYQASRQYSVDGLNLTVTGYTGGVNSSIQKTDIGVFGNYGLGAENAPTPDHAIDNANSNFDMLLFTFDKAVSLDSASISWWQKDSDMTVLAYTGTGSAASTFLDQSWKQAITADSWSGAHFSDVAQNGSTVASNPLALTSTSWLVGTFLEPVSKVFSGFGFSGKTKTGSDYVKLQTINVSTSHVVPEIDGSHAALALGLLAGLVAFASERRRKFAKV